MKLNLPMTSGACIPCARQLDTIYRALCDVKCQNERIMAALPEPAPQPPVELWSRDVVLDYMGVCTKTLYRLEKKQYIKCVEIRRSVKYYHPEAVMRCYQDYWGRAKTERPRE